MKGVERPTLDDFPTFETWLKQTADCEAAHTNEQGMLAHTLGMGSGEIGDLLENEFIFVGTMERFTESVDCLAGILGKPRAVLVHVNKTERPENDLEK